MGTVCTTTLLRSLVDLDVLDNQVAGIKTFRVGVGLSVLEKTKQEFGRLDGPASAGSTPSLA